MAGGKKSSLGFRPSPAYKPPKRCSHKAPSVLHCNRNRPYHLIKSPDSASPGTARIRKSGLFLEIPLNTNTFHPPMSKSCQMTILYASPRHCRQWENVGTSDRGDYVQDPTICSCKTLSNFLHTPSVTSQF